MPGRDHASMLKHHEKVDALKLVPSEKEVRDILVDLLGRMGFKNILLTHQYGAPEYGKDVIASFEHEHDGIEWYSFVVKHGRILGNAKVIEDVITQIAQCFEYPYESVNGSKCRINKVKVVSNEGISNGAIQAIHHSIRLKSYPNVDFWHGDALIDKIDANYGDFWEPGGLVSKEYVRSALAIVKSETEIRELNIKKLDSVKIERLVGLFIEPLISELRQENSARLHKSMTRKRVSVDDIVKMKENVVINGDPGTGKSKLLNHLFEKHLDAQSIEDTGVYPVKVRIATLRVAKFDIGLAVREEVKRISPRYIESHSFDDSSFVVFIDSIDDLHADEVDELVSAIDSSIEAGKHRFIVTARSLRRLHLDGAKHKFRALQLHVFEQRQVEAFVSRFFEGSSRGEKLIHVLKTSNILSKLPATPLVLTLVSLLFDDTDYEIPATMTDIYQDFVSIMLGKLEVRHSKQLLELEVKKRIFSYIAMKMLTTKRFEVDIECLRKDVVGFLASKGIHPSHDDDIVRLLVDSGMMYIGDDGQVGFKHISFVEFFAAFEIFYVRSVSHSVLVERFNDGNWQNAAVFYGGFSKDMPWFINEILEKSPNGSLRDWIMNVSGFGYLSQALYMTDVECRNRLIHRALDDAVLAFDELKSLTAKEGVYHNMPLHLVGGMLAFWFVMNFQSITLAEPLKMAFDDLEKIEDPGTPKERFSLGLRMLLVSCTLAKDYIGEDRQFEKLVYKDWFLRDPLLLTVSDMYLDVSDDVSSKVLAGRVRDRIEKEMRTYRELLVRMTQDPAYRFGTDYRKLTKAEAVEQAGGGTDDAETEGENADG